MHYGPMETVERLKSMQITIQYCIAPKLEMVKSQQLNRRSSAVAENHRLAHYGV